MDRKPGNTRRVRSRRIVRRCTMTSITRRLISTIMFRFARRRGHQGTRNSTRNRFNIRQSPNSPTHRCHRGRRHHHGNYNYSSGPYPHTRPMRMTTTRGGRRRTKWRSMTMSINICMTRHYSRRRHSQNHRHSTTGPVSRRGQSRRMRARLRPRQPTH